MLDTGCAANSVTWQIVTGVNLLQRSGNINPIFDTKTFFFLFKIPTLF